MDGNIRPPRQRGSSRKPIRRRFAPGSAGMGDFPERFYCSAAESSRQCTHPAANSCRAGGRITSDNIPLSEPIPSVIGWIRLRCPARTAYLFAPSSAFAPKGVRFPPVSGHFHRGSALPRCATSRHRPLFKAVGQTLRPQSTQKESAAEWMSPSSWATG